MRQYLLRGEILWDVRDTGLGSWVWRKILKFWNLAKQLIRMDIGNGQSVRFWSDFWHLAGRLIEITREIGMQNLGIARNARICDVYQDGTWRIRVCRDQQLQRLVQEIHRFPLTLTDDTVDGIRLKNGPDYGDKFLASSTWHQIR